LSSLAPFLIENESERSERERDLLLLSDKANLSDPVLIDGFKKYFDRSSIESKRVEYKGIALAGFDFDKYPAQDVKGIATEIESTIRSEMQRWLSNLSSRLSEEKLAAFEIHFFLIPPTLSRFIPI
jgi:hypothetical protein